MENAPATPLKKTPLHARHRASGARLLPIHGWDMPFSYSGLTDEHDAVRARAGILDLSHLGELEVAGKDALAALQRLCSNDLSRLDVGHAQYSGLLSDTGTFIDDLMVFRLAPQHFLLVVNAANTAKDYTWIAAQIENAGDVVVVDVSSRYALLAVQGPLAVEALQPLIGADLRSLKPQGFVHGEVANVRATVSRTGFTGEDGFEVLVPPQSADKVWQAVLASGTTLGLLPVGLEALDTLRLEAGMRLYGQDIDETTTPLEAGLGAIVGWNKQDFNGAAVLREQRAHGVARQLVGFEMLDEGVAAPGREVFAGDTVIGAVTSGSRSPSLQQTIGMAYVQPPYAAPSSELEIDIDGHRGRARVVPMPFYRGSRK